MIDAKSTLIDIAFAVCTAFAQNGKTLVLTGGNAATVYAPLHYQSLDLDFVMQFASAGNASLNALSELGFVASSGSMYRHAQSPITIDFISGDLMIGNQYISEWATLKRESEVLYILKRADCVCDRLASYIYWNDVSALKAAAAVYASSKPDIESIRQWLANENADVEQTINRLLAMAMQTSPPVQP